MNLTKEQIKELKNRLLKQIGHLPNNKKEEAIKQIENLSDEAIEEMFNSQNESQIKVFREIISGKIPSKKVDENEKAIAVLDIKPLSKGHTIIIPKEPLKDLNKIPAEIAIFVDQVSKKLSEKLLVKEIKISPELKFEEVVINLIPIYEKKLSLDDDRLNISDDEINKTLDLIKKEKVQERKQESKKEEITELKKFPKRIP